MNFYNDDFFEMDFASLLRGGRILSDSLDLEFWGVLK
tara:strand:- start:2921 stop:3031 length:111 start_codon:yes stop_codon:yes gene_type:complete